jgi:hypothetical protein
VTAVIWAESDHSDYSHETGQSTMRLFGPVFIVFVATLLPAEAQEVSFTCTSNVPEFSFTIFTTAQQSKVGERIQLSSTSKGITYWKVSLRAIEIEDRTVTYQSSEGALISRRTGKPIPGKLELLVSWNEDGATYTLFMPRGFNTSQPKASATKRSFFFDLG